MALKKNEKKKKEKNQEKKKKKSHDLLDYEREIRQHCNHRTDRTPRRKSLFCALKVKLQFP